jgi:hypothetical protein
MRAVILAGVVAALGACGGSDESDGGTSGGNCALTLSGAITATSGCTMAVAHSDSKTETAIAILGVPDAGYAHFSFTANLGSADLANESYTVSNVTQAVTVASADLMKFWNQSLNDSPNPDQGTFTLAISSAGLKIPADGGAVWMNTQGTFDATLPAVSTTGATGTVTAHVAF